jgi:hypothetical protein
LDQLERIFYRRTFHQRQVRSITRDAGWIQRSDTERTNTDRNRTPARRAPGGTSVSIATDLDHHDATEAVMQPAALFFYLFLVATHAPATSSIAQEPWPKNIWVQSSLRDTMRSLWHHSPTFRAQCLKIGEHRRYHVQIVMDAALVLQRRCRAQCTLRTFSSGLVMARIAVPDKHELTELIPHEIEHVLEHIEGVDLRRNLVTGGHGVYEAGDGRLESARAISAGRKVRAEMAEVAESQLVTRR